MEALLGTAGIIGLLSFLLWPRKPRRISQRQHEFMVAWHNQQMANRLGPPRWRSLSDYKIDEA